MKVLTLMCSWVIFFLPIQLWAVENDQAVLIIHGMNINNSDQILDLSIIEYGIDDFRINEAVKPEIKGNNTLYRISNIKGDKAFQIPRSVSLNLSTVPFYFISSGDSINISIHKNMISFSGKGSEKFEVLYAINQIKQEETDNENKTIDSQIKNNLNILKLQEAYLNKHQSLMSEIIFGKILNGIRMYTQILNYGTLNTQRTGDEKDMAVIDLLDVLNSKIINDIQSPYFPAYFLQKYIFEEVKSKSQKFSFNQAFGYIESKAEGINKEALLTYVISRQLRSLSISKDQLFVLHDFKNDTLRGYIDILIKGRVSGAKAPAFSLTGIDGKEYTSEMFAGRILVLDFWFTGCGACQFIPPILGPIAEKYKENDDVIFLSISIDKDMEIWKDSVKKGKYTFDHSLHLYTSGKGQHHSIMNDYTVSGCPTILLISKSGVILSIPESVRNDNGKSLENQINYELNKGSS